MMERHQGTVDVPFLERCVLLALDFDAFHLNCCRRIQIVNTAVVLSLSVLLSFGIAEVREADNRSAFKLKFHSIRLTVLHNLF